MAGYKLHTILLAQFTEHKANTRQWMDYETVAGALNGVVRLRSVSKALFVGICQLFEAKLKKEQPDADSITYDIRFSLHFVAEADCIHAWQSIVQVHREAPGSLMPSVCQLCVVLSSTVVCAGSTHRPQSTLRMTRNGSRSVPDICCGNTVHYFAGANAGSLEESGWLRG
jgi:hypothetical protein